MRWHRRSSTLAQLAAAMTAFVVCALLLESGGLYDWAQRLELGPLRSVTLPMTSGVHRIVAPLGLEHLRETSITTLARAGWSDDPAAAEGATNASRDYPASVTLPVPSPTQPGVVPEAKLALPPATPRRPLLPMAGDPPLLSELPVLGASTTPRIVALAGDSMMAVGLSATLLRQSPRYPGVHFVKAFKSGTGLARPEVFNWQQEYPAMLAGIHPDVVVVAIGANDGQGFVEDGVTYPFGGDGWKTIYQQRLAAYLQMVAQPGTQVIWLGLPPMKSDAYNARIALVNRIAYTVVQANPQATWFSTAGLIGENDGSFRDFGDIGGKTTRLRASDGIHFSDEGATLVTDRLMSWLAAPPSIKPPDATKPQDVKP